MRTPMQELIEWIDTIISVLPDGSGAKNQMIIAKEKAESMLEKEKEVAHQYAEFAIECDRKELPVLEFDGWINL